MDGFVTVICHSYLLATVSLLDSGCSVNLALKVRATTVQLQRPCRPEVLKLPTHVSSYRMHRYKDWCLANYVTWKKFVLLFALGPWDILNPVIINGISMAKVYCGAMEICFKQAEAHYGQFSDISSYKFFLLQLLCKYKPDI